MEKMLREYVGSMSTRWKVANLDELELWVDRAPLDESVWPPTEAEWPLGRDTQCLLFLRKDRMEPVCPGRIKIDRTGDKYRAVEVLMLPGYETEFDAARALLGDRVEF